jgi:hypothetical protein
MRSSSASRAGDASIGRVASGKGVPPGSDARTLLSFLQTAADVQRDAHETGAATGDRQS